jgi:CRISPR/Cas system CMR-associated protein Cmr3 (group 5 of RAMP superfamily)
MAQLDSKENMFLYDDIHYRFENGCMMMIYIIENERLCWLSKAGND